MSAPLYRSRPGGFDIRPASQPEATRPKGGTDPIGRNDRYRTWLRIGRLFFLGPIKVEVPWGEIYRHSTARMMGVDSEFTGSAPFQMTNRGKRSLTLDLALPQAQAALKKVVDTADVLLTNMLPSRLARYGLGPDALLAERPEAIGRPELARDERFADGFARYRNAEELVKILDAVFAEQTMEAWSERLDAHRLIWAPVRSHAEAAEDPTAAARGIFPTVEHADHGTFKTIGPPFSMSRHAIPGNAPASALGADTAAVRSEAGVDDDTIALLVAAST